MFLPGHADVARLEPPEDASAVRADGLVPWMPSFPTYPETTLWGMPGELAIDDALVHVDMSLDADG